MVGSADFLAFFRSASSTCFFHLTKKYISYLNSSFLKAIRLDNRKKLLKFKDLRCELYSGANSSFKIKLALIAKD